MTYSNSPAMNKCDYQSIIGIFDRVSITGCSMIEIMNLDLFFLSIRLNNDLDYVQYNLIQLIRQHFVLVLLLF